MRLALVLGALLPLSFACAPSSGDATESDLSVGDVGDPDGASIVAAPEAGRASADFTSSTGQYFLVTEHVNVHVSPRASAAAIRVLPKGSIVQAVTGGSGERGYLNVSGSGTTGWIFTNFLAVDTGRVGGGAAGGEDDVDIDGPPSPKVAIARAKSAMGFSYYWGGAAWPSTGLTDDNAGSCSGNCPSCRHRGSFGADCSGLIAKAWKFSEGALDQNSHPFSTADFVAENEGHWSTLASREDVKKADAFVFRSGGSGHIVLYERGDSWGSPVVYECKSCAVGCVYNARTLGSAYKPIRRDGF